MYTKPLNYWIVAVRCHLLIVVNNVDSRPQLLQLDGPAGEENWAAWVSGQCTQLNSCERWAGICTCRHMQLNCRLSYMRVYAVPPHTSLVAWHVCAGLLLAQVELCVHVLWSAGQLQIVHDLVVDHGPGIGDPWHLKLKIRLHFFPAVFVNNSKIKQSGVN